MLPLLAAFALESSVVTVPGQPWARHTIDSSSRGADGVKLGDINGDGHLDIVTGWEEGGEVRLYLNPGTVKAQVSAAWPHVTIGKVRDVEDAIFTDLDGDGKLDVLSCAEGKTQALFWHRPLTGPQSLLHAESWRTEILSGPAPVQSWMQAASADLDGLAGVEFLTGSKNKNAAISWLQAPGGAPRTSLLDWTCRSLRPAGWVMSMELHDMDGDGDADLLFSDRKGERRGVFWLANPGPEANRRQEAWTEHAIGAVGREVMFLDRGDLNGDGRADVAAALKPVEIALFLQQPDGGWQTTLVPLIADHLGDAKAVKMADINGDGLTDLLFTCENAKGPKEGLVWLEQVKGGAWKQRPLGGPEGVKFDLMQTLDLDGDGDLDVLTCEERDQLGVVWYENPSR